MHAVPLDTENDGRVILRCVSWFQYEVMLAMRGDAPSPRLTYLHGALELMSPSRSHESIKKDLARLIETYAFVTGMELIGHGSETMRRRAEELGAEPDECYALGVESAAREDTADLAIEVIWTSGGVDKLEVYRGLEIGEVWFWRKGKIEVHVLRKDHYVETPRSELLPDLDLELLTRFIGRPDQTAAAREFAAAIKTPARPRARKPRPAKPRPAKPRPAKARPAKPRRR